jgi:hypothetical protein
MIAGQNLFSQVTYEEPAQALNQAFAIASRETILVEVRMQGLATPGQAECPEPGLL